MPILRTVWDSNIYRRLSWPDFESLAVAERSQSVVPIANYTVVMELLARLADQNEESFRFGVSAIRRMWKHVVRFSGSNVLDFVQDYDAVLCRILFGQTIANPFDGMHLNARTLGEVAKVSHMSELSDLSREFILHMREFVEEKERGFIDTLFRSVVQTINPDATSWSEASSPGPLRSALLASIKRNEGLEELAEAIVTNIGSRFKSPISDADLVRKRDLVLQQFPVPIRAQHLLIERILSDGTDMRKKGRPNSVWDMQIAYSTGRDIELSGRPIWVVTDDALLLDAARISGARRFLSLSEYRNKLQLSWTEFQSKVADS